MVHPKRLRRSRQRPRPTNREQASQAARNYLREAAERTYGDGITKQTEVLVSDQPANAISEYAEKHDIDLIVMSSHGRGGITRVALGSVADKVIRGAKTPVLVLRPTDEAAEDDQQSEAAAANA